MAIFVQSLNNIGYFDSQPFWARNIETCHILKNFPRATKRWQNLWPHFIHSRALFLRRFGLFLAGNSTVLKSNVFGKFFPIWTQQFDFIVHYFGLQRKLLFFPKFSLTVFNLREWAREWEAEIGKREREREWEGMENERGRIRSMERERIGRGKGRGKWQKVGRGLGVRVVLGLLGKVSWVFSPLLLFLPSTKVFIRIYINDAVESFLLGKGPPPTSAATLNPPPLPPSASPAEKEDCR